MKKVLFLLTFMLLFCALPVFAMAEGEEIDPANPYGIYVGGVAVTEANQSDILGDGTAFYTPQNDTLTLRHFKATEFYSLKGTLYSVYCSGKTNILIEGKDNRFPQGIFTAGGSITLKGADVHFGNSAFFFLYASEGDLTLENSAVWLGDLTYVQSDSYCVIAKNIKMKNSSFTLSTTTPTTTYCNAILYATTEFIAEDSGFLFSLPYPICGAMFLGGNLMFDNCDIDITRGNYAFHTQWGVIQFSECNVKVKETRSFSSSPDFLVVDSKIEASLFYQGIHAVGSTEGEGFVAASSKLDLKMLSFEEIESTIMRSIWDNMDASERVDFGQSYDNYILSFKNTSYKTATEGNAAIAVTGGGCYLYKTEITTKDFDFGILGLYGVPLEIDSRCDLKLSANAAAFLWFALSYEGVLLDSHRLSGSRLTYTDVPKSLEKVGTIAVCSSENRLTFKGSGDIESTADLLDRISGMGGEIRIRTAPYTSTIVLVTLLLVLLGGGFTLAAVMIFVPNFRMAKAIKAQKKKTRK